MKISQRLLYLVAAVLLAVGAAVAQSGTGQISGTVFDPTGAIVVGASVKVTNDRTGAVRSTQTGPNGAFVMAALPPGPHTVDITHTGFQTHQAKEVTVSVGADNALRVTLQPGAVESTVTVNEAAVHVQTSETALSTLVDSKTLVALPLNRRNPLHFIGLLPGVVGHSSTATSSAGTTTHNINGDRGRGIETQLDGIAISDPIIPRGELTNAPVNPDMVQEFRVITATAPAGLGRNSGAQIQMVTKSGTNEWHGSAFHFFRNTVLDANSFFNNHGIDPFTRTSPIAREELKQNQFGATGGGPIIKNKLFVFGSWESTRRSQSFLESNTAYTQSARSGLFRFVRGTVNGSTQLSPSFVDAGTGALLPSVAVCSVTVTNNCIDTYNIVANDPRGIGLNPTMTALANLFPVPNDYTGGDGLNTALFKWNAPTQAPADTYAWRVDYTINAKHELFHRYTLAWRNHLIGDFINGGLPRTPSTGPGRERLSRNQSAAVGWKWLVNNRMVSTSVIGFTRNTLNFADNSHPHRTGDPIFSVVPELRTTVMSSPFVLWGATRRHPEHLQAKNDMSMQRGSHSFSFGGEWRFYRFNNFRGTGSNPGGSGISIFPSVFFTSGVVPFTGTAPNTVVANATDRGRLQGMFNELLGIVSNMDQIMYSDGTQYQPGRGLIMYQRQKEWNAYFHDDWRLNKHLTLNLGIRYELYGVPYDSGPSQVVPNQPLNQPGVSFISAGPGTGREWYQTDRNNFAPTIGAAWDPWGDGKTVVRGSYRVAYNRLVGWSLNVVEQRQPAVGLDPQIFGACFNPGTGLLVTCPPGASTTAVPFRIPELNRHPGVVVANGLASLAPPNPNAVQPTPPNLRRESPFFFADDFRSAYVHQFVLNIQREIRPNLVAEVGYVGSRGRKLFRFNNVNQIELRSNGFLQEFINAQGNLRICRANQVACRTAAGSTSTTFASFGNLGLTGQVAVPIFSALFSATSSQTAAGFANTTSIGNLDTNNIGTLANSMDRALNNSRGPCTYAPLPNPPGTGVCTPTIPGASDSFFRPNPQFDVAGLGTSNSESDYHSLQMQVRGTYRWGLQFAANYTLQKSIDDQSDETVGAGTGFSFPFDSNNVITNRARSDFDVNHVFRSFVIYDLPFGRGKRWGDGVNGITNQILGGWQINTIVDISSGFPFTVTSGSQTDNYFVTTPANCGTDASGWGRTDPSDARGGVWFFHSALRQSTFNVQTNSNATFTMPAAGTIGTCGRNTFTGPGFVQFDFGINKKFQITETWNLDFRTEMFNAFNSANFSNPGTLSIQSANFGKITSTRAPNRIMQFALKLTF